MKVSVKMHPYRLFYILTCMFAVLTYILYYLLDGNTGDEYDDVFSLLDVQGYPRNCHGKHYKVLPRPLLEV